MYSVKLMIVGTHRIITWKMGMIIMHDAEEWNPESFIGSWVSGPLGPISQNQNFKKAAFEI